MTVLRTTLLNAFRSTALLVIASSLIACQAETSAQNDAPSVEAKAAQVESVVDDNHTHAEPHAGHDSDHGVKPVVTPVSAAIPVKAKAPADFSQLDSSKYKNVDEILSVSTGNDIEVTELFWFGCGHCFALEPHIKKWLANKPSNAKFKKVPAIFSKRWEFHGKAFYTMQALNVPEKAYDELFSQIHVQKRNINNLKALTAFLAPYGKDKTLVESTFNSFAVDSKLRNAVKITKASGARGVPAMIIDGKYLTSQSDAGGTEQMFDVVDKLVAKSASER